MSIQLLVVQESAPVRERRGYEPAREEDIEVTPARVRAEAERLARRLFAGRTGR